MLRNNAISEIKKRPSLFMFILLLSTLLKLHTIDQQINLWNVGKREIGVKTNFFYLR